MMDYKCAGKTKSRQVNTKFSELKNIKYRDGIKSKETNRDDYVYVIGLDEGISHAPLACVHLPQTKNIC